MLLSNLRQRLARDEGGFTLIELLVVLIIIAVLLAIAIPSYLGFKDRAEKRASQSNVRAAIPAVEAYFSDPVAEGGGGSSYANVTLTKLKTIDAAIKLDTTMTGSASTYCVQHTVGKYTAHKAGPEAEIVVGAAGTPCTAAP